jgi:hypothetical protein
VYVCRSKFIDHLFQTTAITMGIQEVFGSREFIDWLKVTICSKKTFNDVCDSLVFTGTSDYYNEVSNTFLSP